jgi:hypothetical protein
MDPKSGLPEIKPQVNQETKEDRKKGGFFARLFGAGAAGEGGAGLGGVVDIGGAAASGGLLATKAGLIALILGGSTVAAAVGLLGYHFLGPGQDDGTDAGLSVFAAKPKGAAADAAAGANAGKDGNSDSLSMLAKANGDVNSPGEGSAAGGAPKDATAADAASASASAAGTGGPNTAMSDSAGGAGHKLMNNTAKFGALGASFGSGGAAAGGSSASAPKIDPTAASKGALTAMAPGRGAAASAASARSAAGHSNGAIGQAFGALGDQRGGMAGSSYQAGRTYDGSTTGGVSSIGPQAGLPSVGSAGTSGTQASQTSTPNPANTKNNSITAPPTPSSANVTPWQGDIQAAEALVALALILMLMKSKLMKMLALPTTGFAMHAISIIMGMIGLAVIALGARIAGGSYGQVLQGHMLAAAGVGIMIAAVGSFMGDAADAASQSTTGGTTATSTTTGGAATANSYGGIFVLVGGGMALLSTAAAALQPPTSYPSSDFPNGVPGKGWFSMGHMPSQDALKHLS